MSGSLGGLGTAVGSAFGGPLGGAIGGAVGGLFDNRSARRRARGLSRSIVPRKINTGKSVFNTQTGAISLDPSIRAGEETFLNNVRGLQSDINPAFDTFLSGISGLQGEVGGLRSAFEGNQSAFREASLRPLQEKISTRRGALNTELSRTGVRGSFRNNELNRFETGAGVALSDQEAKIENERINNLGNLLGMDADLLKASLAGETGRTQLLLNLENSLRGVSADRFAQEMQLLGLPAQFVQGKAAGAGFLSNQAGIERQVNTQNVGNILGAIDFTNFGSGPFGSSLVLPNNPHSA